MNVRLPPPPRPRPFGPALSPGLHSRGHHPTCRGSPIISFRDLGLRALDRLRPSDAQRTLAAAAVVGAAGGLATAAFRAGLGLIEQFLYARSDGLVRIATALPDWQRLLAPAAGGLIAGALLVAARRVARGATGTDYMEAIAVGDGDLPVRVSLLRALSSAATVTSGGAIGREGPMVQLAALVGSLFGRWRKLPVPRRRLFVACGAAAGIATAYNAPIAGALFVAEIILHSLAIDTIGALLFASVAGTLAASAVSTSAPVYRIPEFVLPTGVPSLLLALIGVLAGVGAPLFLWVLDRCRDALRRLPVPVWLRLAVGGLAAGAISVAAPAVWGNGYSVVNSILAGGWTVQALLLVLAFKVLAVGATTGSGAIGGIFTPTLFVGAATGALCAAAAQALGAPPFPAAAATAVGMGAFLAACTHAPLTSVLMIFELTANYGVVIPLMLACVLAYSIARAIRSKSIYATVALAPHVATLACAADLARPQPATVREGASVQDLEAVFLRSRWPHVYVLDEGGRFLGAISLHDLTARRADPRGLPPAWPAELVRTDFPRVQPETPSWQVLATFAAHPGERLPVVAHDGRLAGYVTKTDFVLMMHDRLTVD